MTDRNEPHTMLPETLPEPEKVGAHTLSPRQRSMQHLRSLTGRASSLSAGLGLTACVGFGVVDPLPDPVECTVDDFGPEMWSYASARGRPDAFEVTLQIDFVVQGATFVSVEVEGAESIVNGDLGGTELAIQVAPDKGAKVVQVRVVLDCRGEVAAPVVFSIPVDEVTKSMTWYWAELAKRP